MPVIATTATAPVPALPWWSSTRLPGIHPGVVAFGRRLVAAGSSVHLPPLFGRPGESLSTTSTARSIARVCVAREFAIPTAPARSPHGYERSHSTRNAECGGPGVGAVGMCFTGSFALAMAVEPAVLAPVLSQPALPAPLTTGKRAVLGLVDEPGHPTRAAPERNGVPR